MYMDIKRRNLLAVPLLATGISSIVLAQTTWPNRPIKFVVPFGAGGPTDIMARALSEKMKSYLNVSIIVENKPGGTGQIGTESVMRAAPDGYTFLVGVTQNFTILPNIRKVPYDIDSFDIIAGIADYAAIITVKKELGVRTLNDLIRYARNNPGKLTWGSTGIGSASHVNGEQMKKHAEIDMLHVPYKSAADAVTGFLSGEIDILIDAAGIPLIDSGRAIGLANFANRRHPEVPNIPAITEFKEFKVGLPNNAWHVMAPLGTPVEILRVMSEFIEKSVNDKDTSDKLLKAGGFPKYTPGPELKQTMIQSRSYFKSILSSITIQN
jgi:tripartite-type tricarboxylate transporter receptor subunit TctC